MGINDQMLKASSWLGDMTNLPGVDVASTSTLEAEESREEGK